MDERIHPFERAVEDWHWWYRVRRSILDAYLDRLPLDPERSLLLDIGSGTGGSAVVMSRHGRVVALDRAQRSFSLSMDRPYRHRVVASADVLPFRDHAFDAVAALDILEHLDDDVAGAREIRRVLKPGGTAIFFVPAFQFLWRQNDVFAHHKRRYTRAQLDRTLRAAGFAVDQIGYFNLLLMLPLVAATLVEKLAPSAVEGVERLEKPTVLNSVLGRIFSLELPLLRRAPLPLGASVMCLARRDD